MISKNSCSTPQKTRLHYKDKSIKPVQGQNCRLFWECTHTHTHTYICRSQWPPGLSLRHRSAVARLLRSWVRIPPDAWMFVYCECCVLSGRGLCDGADHSSRGVLPTVMRRCVWSRNRKNEEAMACVGPQRHRKNSYIYIYIYIYIYVYIYVVC